MASFKKTWVRRNTPNDIASKNYKIIFYCFPFAHQVKKLNWTKKLIEWKLTVFGIILGDCSNKIHTNGNTVLKIGYHFGPEMYLIHLKATNFVTTCAAFLVRNIESGILHLKLHQISAASGCPYDRFANSFAHYLNSNKCFATYKFLIFSFFFRKFRCWLTSVPWIKPVYLI